MDIFAGILFLMAYTADLSHVGNGFKLVLGSRLMTDSALAD
jgi:hypothetical protein